MQTITLKLKLLKSAKEKITMYRRKTTINTGFSNWLLIYQELKTAASKSFKLFSEEEYPTAVVKQTIRIVKPKKGINRKTISVMLVRFQRSKI
ncbi:hypothetical protein I2483_19040 [Sporosarcina sp. E16_3]|uniref:hypothetical protein n=1 Tax=Sporosarcina sp. E16_3 TaxID=2789293 RepID=UPI001A938A46|nr:hypothetical protein [Sporosarcina sp. E16_3]MBO0603763.1 hypothetical protein [Sporosarcina sp. E16_3]